MIHTKLEIITDQLLVEGQRNPIEFIKARLNSQNQL